MIGTPNNFGIYFLFTILTCYAIKLPIWLENDSSAYQQIYLWLNTSRGLAPPVTTRKNFMCNKKNFEMWAEFDMNPVKVTVVKELYEKILGLGRRGPREKVLEWGEEVGIVW